MVCKTYYLKSGYPTFKILTYGVFYNMTNEGSLCGTF